MSAKDCGHHRWHERNHKFLRRLFFCLILLVIVVAVIVLVVWLVLRPTKPKFWLQDATVMAFNVSTNPSLLTTTLQVTVSSRNPNDRIGIYYDSLDVYATYKSQQITIPYVIPSTYQGHNDVSVWSPFLSGNLLPMAPYLSLSLTQDENAGVALLHVMIDGRVRWKVGSWVSKRYHLFVNCPAYLTFDSGGGKGGMMTKASPAVARFQQISSCSVDV